MEEFRDILNGTLLGDGCIFLDRHKYSRYKLTAKDKNFLKWIESKFIVFNMKCYFGFNKINQTNFLYGSTSSLFNKLRLEWYKNQGKPVKIVPKNLELSPTVLLYWYLGDGSLIRRKNDSCRVPYIVLATNAFSKEDIEFLIQKLKKLDLNFYPVKYKSGFTKKESGYCLYSKTQGDTPFRFFKLIGLECPKEIANCSTGRKGIYHEEKFFKDKWPTEEDWIKILSNTKGIGKIIREKRKQLDISRKELTKLLGVNKDYIRKIESGRRNPSVDKFRKVLKALNLDISYLLNELRREG